MYEYDAVTRLRDSQLGDERVKDIANYIKKGKLWDAFTSDKQVVLLIDEIDKGEKVVIIDKGKVLDSGDVEKIVKKTKTKNIREAFNKLVGIKT